MPKSRISVPLDRPDRLDFRHAGFWMMAIWRTPVRIGGFLLRTGNRFPIRKVANSLRADTYGV
jgi:hypothetical protein